MPLLRGPFIFESFTGRLLDSLQLRTGTRVACSFLFFLRNVSRVGLWWQGCHVLQIFVVEDSSKSVLSSSDSQLHFHQFHGQKHHCGGFWSVSGLCSLKEFD